MEQLDVADGGPRVEEQTWLRHLWVSEFRSYRTAEVELPAGLTAVVGPNGHGKSNLLEAVGYLVTLQSFRGAGDDALVRTGSDRAVVRGEVLSEGRLHLVEAELARSGRNRILIDKQRLTRRRDLVGIARCTVFAPDDLDLVKGGPALRRSFLDDLLVSLHPRYEAVRSEWERSLKQRNALLKQIQGRPDEAQLLTLEVWDQKLAAAGDELVRLRRELVVRIGPTVSVACADIAGEAVPVELRYESPWSTVDGRGQGLAEALAAVRNEELRRGVTVVGPHRDELELSVAAMPARTHASQGEQRTLALALRLAGHRLLTQTYGAPPLLLLDDVFSELDPQRSAALLHALPVGQTLLSSAAGLPSGVEADLVLDVRDGAVSPRRP